MNERTTQHPKGFVAIPNQWIRGRDEHNRSTPGRLLWRLKGIDLAVLMVILSYPRQPDGTFWTTQESVARVLNVGSGTVSKSISRMVGNDLMTTKTQPGRNGKSQFRLNPKYFPEEGFTTPENPSSGKVQTLPDEGINPSRMASKSFLQEDKEDGGVILKNKTEQQQGEMRCAAAADDDGDGEQTSDHPAYRKLQEHGIRPGPKLSEICRKLPDLQPDDVDALALCMGAKPNVENPVGLLIKLILDEGQGVIDKRLRLSRLLSKPTTPPQTSHPPSHQPPKTSPKPPAEHPAQRWRRELTDNQWEDVRDQLHQKTDPLSIKVLNAHPGAVILAAYEAVQSGKISPPERNLNYNPIRCDNSAVIVASPGAGTANPPGLTTRESAPAEL